MTSWPLVTLASLCRNAKADIVDGPFGSNLKREDYITSGIPVLKIQNIKESGVILKKMDYVSPEKFTELSRHSFRRGDIVITKLGDPLGIAAVVDEIDEGLIVADLVRIRVDRSRVDTRYLAYAINSTVVRTWLNDQQKGSTRPRVSLLLVRAMPIPLPPLEEQERIVAKLDRIDESCAALGGLVDQREQGTKDFIAAVRFEALRSIRERALAPSCSLGRLEEAGLIQIGRGKVISKRDLEATPGNFPVYSSSGTGSGEFGRYGKFMFDEEMITWSVDGGGHLFYRPRHKYSVTNVGGWIRILKPEQVRCDYLFEVLADMHSRITFDWVYKAHSGVIKKVYDEIYLPSLDDQAAVVSRIKRATSAAERTTSVLRKEKVLIEDLKSASRVAILGGGS